MFFSVQKIKKSGCRVSPSLALMNAFKCINDTPLGNLWTVEGKPFPRVARYEAWRLTLNHSSRIDGKVKKKQVFIKTFNFWDIVNDYMRSFRMYGNPEDVDIKKEEQSGSTLPCSVYYFVSEDKILEVMDEHFPEQKFEWEPDLMKKVCPFISEVIKDFEKSPEFKCFLKYQILQDEVDYENARSGESSSHEQANRDEHSHSKGQSNLMNMEGVILNDDEKSFILKYRNTIAKKIHPDHGGDTAEMQILNGLVDKIRGN